MKKFLFLIFFFPTFVFGAFSTSTPYGSGDRSSTISMDSSMTPSAGAIQNWVNGNIVDNNTYGPNVSASGNYVEFLFDEAIVVQKFYVYGSTFADMGTWKFQGSNNGLSWTDLGSTFVYSLLSGSYVEYTTPSANTTAYLYYRILGVSGTYSDGPYVHEFEFYWDYPAGGGGGDPATTTPSVTSLNFETITGLTFVIDVLFIVGFVVLVFRLFFFRKRKVR